MLKTINALRLNILILENYKKQIKIKIYTEVLKIMVFPQIDIV